jgi:hypothetical protein
VTRFAALAAVVLLACSACGGSGSAAHGGSGVVTAGRVGPLRVDVSTRAAIVAFAGKPDVTVTSRTPWPGVPRYRALAYSCSHTSRLADEDLPDHQFCRTIYYVNSRTRRLAAFYTYSPAFCTTNGIRPGMAQNAADRRKHQTPQGPWNAIGGTSSSANLILPSSCHRVTSGRCAGKVVAFMLESRHHPVGLLFT